MSDEIDENDKLKAVFCQVFTTGAPREALLIALTAMSNAELAHSVVDALDEYLAEDSADRVPARIVSYPDYQSELQRLQRDLGEAIERAEKAERALREQRKA